MKEYFKSLCRDLLYVFINYIVAYIPFWTIRKALYSAVGMHIGKGSRIMMRCIVMAPWRIKIGDNTMINEYVLLDGRGGLTIESSVSISAYTLIYTGTHKSFSPTFEYASKPVSISNCCWLGARSVIMPGSDLQRGTIVSVNSVFKGSSEPNGIYDGIPARLVRYRDINTEYNLKNIYFFR